MRLLLLISTLYSFSASAAPSCKALQSRWQSKYHEDFGATWKRKGFPCPSAMAKLSKAIYDLEMPRLNKDYYGFAASKIRSTVFSNSCRKRTVATMLNGKMTLCTAYFRDSPTSRVGTFVHEAAHAYASDPGHVVCRSGYYKGRKACDRSLAAGSAGSGYRKEFDYLTELSHDTSYHHLKKSAVRYSIRQLITNRFNYVDPNIREKWL